MKKTLSLIVAFCMIFSLAAVAEGVSFDVKKSPFANTISNQQAFSLDIYGDYCYVSARAGGVQIFDISDINNITNIITDNPDLSAEMQTDGNNVKVYNGYLYAGFTGQLAKFSLQNPASPVLTASLSDIPAGVAMAFSGNLMFVTRNSNGALYICDISEETLEIKRTISTDSALGKHRAVYVRGDYLYISCAKGLRIFDISSGNADDVTEVVSLSLDTSNINDICVSDKAIFLSDWGTRVLYIVDLTTAKPLSELTSEDAYKYEIGSFSSRGVYVDGDVLYYTSDTGILSLFDVSTPTTPIEIASVSGLGQLPDIDIENNVAYLANRGGGIIAIPIPPFAYLKLPEEEYTSFPVLVSGNVLGGAAGYDLYVDGVKVKEAAAVDGKINEKIYSLSNGQHELDVAVSGLEEFAAYTVNISAEKNIQVSLLDSSGQAVQDINHVSGAKIKVENDSDETFEGTLISAVYTDHTMTICKGETVSIAAKGSIEKALDIGVIEAPENSALKIFVVKSYSEPALLSNVIELEGGNYILIQSTSEMESSDMLEVDVTAIDHSTKTVEISICQEEFFPTETIVSVAKPGGSSFADLDYIDVVEVVNGQGGFSYNFSGETENAPFNVKVSAPEVFGGYLTRESNFTYVGPVTIAGILQDLSTLEDTENILKTNSGLFRIDLSESSEFYALDEIYRSDILTQMKAEFATPEDVKIAFEEAIEAAKILKQIHDAADIQEIETALSAHENRAMLNLNEEVFSLLDAEAKVELFEAMLNTPNEDKKYARDEFARYFNDNASLALINKSGYLQMGAVLKVLEDKFNLTGDYSKLSNTEDERIYVHKILERTDFLNMDEAVTKFNTAVSQAMENKNASSTSNTGMSRPSGGGGGGGGGGSVSSVVMPTADEQEEIAPLTEEKFTDIDEVQWAKEAICSLAQEGVISGYPDDTFRPNTTVKREEFAKMLCIALQISDQESAAKFTDVNETDWYYTYVMNLNSANIIEGISESLFGAGTELTREDLAVLVVRAAEYKKMDIPRENTLQFSDYSNVADYAKDSVSILANSGIMVGNGDTFSPKDYVTRAMAAKVIFELLKL